MAAGVEIKVTPEVLDQRGLELLTEIKKTEKLFSQIRDTVSKTSS